MLFSEQEKKVINLAFRGHKSSEIADTLSLSVSTVRCYKQRIKVKLRKFGINEIIDLAKLPLFI